MGQREIFVSATESRGVIQDPNDFGIGFADLNDARWEKGEVHCAAFVRLIAIVDPLGQQLGVCGAARIGNPRESKLEFLQGRKLRSCYFVSRFD